MNKETYNISPLWVGPYDEEPDCKYNKAVGCDDQSDCSKCGWNPIVAKARARSGD